MDGIASIYICALNFFVRCVKSHCGIRVVKVVAIEGDGTFASLLERRKSAGAKKSNVCLC